MCRGMEGLGRWSSMSGTLAVTSTFTKRARAGALSKREKGATHGVPAVGSLPLGFQVKLRLVRG